MRTGRGPTQASKRNRFSALVTSVWREGDRLLLAAKTKERDTPVLSNAAIELRS
jgi:hypothetical protein